MNMKNSLVPSLAVAATRVLARNLFSKTGSARPAGGSVSHDSVDGCIEQQMRRLNIPGASQAIVEDDKIVYMRGFGRACPGGDAPSPQTPFVLGSTAKSTTVLAVMQLFEAGKVELDAPIQRHLPWFRVTEPQA